MSRTFLSDDAKAAFLAAVREIEGQSSAEVVISVRPQSGSYLQADLAWGIAAAIATTALLLFLPQPFDRPWFLVDPVLAGALAAFASSRSPRLRRALSPALLRRSRSETSARALFVERSVHGTTGRTGLLLYVSLLEREAVVVPDLGAQAALAGSPGWATALAALEETVRAGEDGLAASRALRGLAGPLAAALPRRADDANELADEMDL